MTFFGLSCKNLLRHRVRSLLTLSGIAASIAVLFSIVSFNAGFERNLSGEIERTGIHFMVVPSGCPHEVASLVLHGAVIPKYLDAGVLEGIISAKGIELASPILVAQLPNRAKGRVDLVYGMEMSNARRLKPSWEVEGSFPKGDDEILLGSEVAIHYGAKPGDILTYSGIDLKVGGILKKTGGQDDAFVYAPINAVRRAIDKPAGATAIGVRVTSPERIADVTDELSSRMPGIQIVTMGQVINSLASLAGSAKVLSLSIAVVAIFISAAGVMNSILMAIFERTEEIGMMRAIGASRLDVFRIIIGETALLTGSGGVLGIALSSVGSGLIEGIVRKFMPYVPSGRMIALDPGLAGLCVAFSIVIGIMAGLYPAWKASRITPVEAIKG